MTEGIDEPFAATVLSDNLMNKVTHGSGTTATRTGLASWAVDRLFFDTDKKTLFRNAGTAANPVWKHASKNIGSIELFAGPAASIPEGALICNGASVSRATYADLFALIGTDFGAGDNGNEFKIPDMRGKLPRGSSDAIGTGSQGGNDEINLTVGQLPAHHHLQGRVGLTVNSNVAPRVLHTDGAGHSISTGASAETGDGDGINVDSPYTAVNYIIYT